MTASEQIDKKIAGHPDWKGRLLTDIRQLVREADPDILEDIKWRGAPSWSHNGLVCVANVFKDTVKVVFSRGAKLADPSGLFNSELAGNAWRGITFSEKDKVNKPAFKKMIQSAVALNSAGKDAQSKSRSTTVSGRGRRK
jgi:hypothetical protein